MPRDICCHPCRLPGPSARPAPFIERFLEAGTLVALGERFVELDRALYAVLSGKGRRKPLARRCLAFFEQD